MKISSDDLISIYDAAISDKNWNRALDSCAALMGAEIASLYEFSTLEKIEYRLEKSCSKILDLQSMVSEYNEAVQSGRGSGYDLEGIPYINKRPQWSVIRDDEIWDLDESYQSRPEIMIPMKQGFFRRTFLKLGDDPATMRGVVFLYGRQFDRELPTMMLENGPQFGPHLSKAAEIFRLTEGLRKKYKAVLSVLDRIDTGVLVVTENADIIVANHIAEQTLGVMDGVRRSQDNILTSSDENSNLALRQAISEISATAKGQNYHSGATIRVSRRGIDPPLIAIISPLRDAEMELDKNLSGVLITLVDPAKPISVQPEIISAAYGLSQAESRVAELVLHGLTNPEISERIGVGLETIKSQVSAIFAKSRSKSRAAFIWRVFQLVPPVK